MQVESPTPAGTSPGIMPLLKPDHVSELAGSVYVRLDNGTKFLVFRRHVL